MSCHRGFHVDLVGAWGRGGKEPSDLLGRCATKTVGGNDSGTPVCEAGAAEHHDRKLIT